MKSEDKHIIDEWDPYWNDEVFNKRFVYNLVAKFYRKYIIRPSLNFYVHRYFPKKSHLLHAGCGSGDVDRDIRNMHDITALDISPMALKMYRKLNGISSKVLIGNIFNIPKNVFYDGIYNLGVMEHYSEKDIQNILSQFKKVIRKKGRMVIFWPPEYGVSVVFFKTLVFIFKNVFGIKKTKLHPTEITRLKSKEHAEKIIKKAGLKIINIHFGLRDLFTYVVVVAEK
jgi:SAM-dependent methyltransferase